MILSLRESRGDVFGRGGASERIREIIGGGEHEKN